MAASIPRALAALAHLRGKLPNDTFTFAVIGDNRGDSDGNPPPVLLDIIAAVNRDAPSLVFSTGDLINAYPEEDEAHLRKLWSGYLAAVKQLHAPIFHVPGNHDLFHDLSARLWTEFVGQTHFAFDFGGVRFIGLDTETEPARIGAAQFEWLRRQLESAAGQRVFLFVHQPLFPVDGHVGNSLDKFPEERDRLHRLFTEHRGIIEGVFHAHEHLFSLQERDGIRYYISAGSGSPLYVPREIGGWYHYLLVHVTPENCAVELKKMWSQPEDASPARVIKPGEVLENWEHPLIWNFWDQTLVQQRVTEPVTHGNGALRLDFNLAQYTWPTLATEFTPPRDLRDVSRIKADIFLDDDSGGQLAVNGAFIDVERSQSPGFALKRGWNTLDLDLDAEWMAPRIRKSVRKFEITFTGPAADKLRSVVIDHIRFERASHTDIFESWESVMQWGTWDETTHPAASLDPFGRAANALQLHLDFGKYQRPRIYSELRPAWDFSDVDGVALDVFVPEGAPKLSMRLSVTGEFETWDSPAVELRPTRNEIVVVFEHLKPQTRRRVLRLEWWVSSNERDAKSWIQLGQFRGK